MTEAREPQEPGEPIRLALVITELRPGGAERCLVELATRIDRARFSPVVYSLGPCPAAAQRLLVNQLAEQNVPAHFLDLTHPWHFWRGSRHLALLLGQQQAQVVQTFLFHANVLGARAAQMAGIPHFVTGIRVADPRRWRSVIERWVTARADKIVCVSGSVADFCRRHGFANDKLMVIPNGIDIARWRVGAADLETFGVPANRRVLLFVGRLEEQKGLFPFFSHLPRLFQQLSQHDLLLVGDGPLRSALQERANRLGIADRVHFAGWQCEIPPIMAAADLLILPSRWEGMPNVILEAMAAAKPVVAMEVEGVREILGNAANSQTAKLGRGEELAARIVEIASRRDLAARLGQENLKRAQEFSVGLMIEAYTNLYTSVLET